MGATLGADGRPIVVLDRISASYGPYRALFDVSFSLAAGSVTALLGPNGAGKTTVARVISGLVKPTSGRLTVGTADATGQPAWKIARLGIAHLSEGRSVFASLTVEENLRLAFEATLTRRGVTAALDRAYTSFPRLGERRAQNAGTLSGGEQRMLALARVLANPPPVLIADELSLGLAPIVVDEVYRALEDLRDRGTTLLVVEQHVHRALDLADDVVLLSKGQVLHAGPADDLGDRIEELLPDATPVSGDPGA